MTRREATLILRGILRPVAGEDSAFEAAQLIKGLCRNADTVDDAKWAELLNCANRRALGEPLQYILGEWSFYGYDFYLSPAALIPRQDSETLVTAALNFCMAQRKPLDILDLCCGTGCLGLALVKKLTESLSCRDDSPAVADPAPRINLALADISDSALNLATRNSARHGVAARLVLGDLFENLQGAQYDLILCNPPYLSAEDMTVLQRELQYEPALALCGGADGLDFYRRLANEAPAHLARGGRLFMEIGSTQSQAVADLFSGAELMRDLSGNPRVAVWGK